MLVRSIPAAGNHLSAPARRSNVLVVLGKEFTLERPAPRSAGRERGAGRDAVAAGARATAGRAQNRAGMRIDCTAGRGVSAETGSDEWAVRSKVIRHRMNCSPSAIVG